MSEINNRIKNLRICAKLSQQELAKKMMVSTQLISKWECSNITPATEDIMQLSKLYNISTDYILYGTIGENDEKFLKRNLEEKEINDELMKEFKSIFKKANNNELNMLIETAKLPKQIQINSVIKNLISFNVESLIEINNFYIYTTAKENYIITGDIKFELLTPNETEMKFFDYAITSDKSHIQDAFEDYSNSEEMWNDEVLLLLINNGAKVIKFSGIEPYSVYSSDACENTMYDPEYQYDLISTKLLKSELERNLNKDK